MNLEIPQIKVQNKSKASNKNAYEKWQDQIVTFNNILKQPKLSDQNIHTSLMDKNNNKAKQKQLRSMFTEQKNHMPPK